MNRRFFFLIFLLFPLISIGQKIQKSELNFGEKLVFYSDRLEAPLEIYIGLPKNYHNSTIDYPVHYVLDGQIIFNYYYGVADILTKGEIPECIMVGIQSVKRGYYFKPGDGANEFMEFLLKELIPYIDSHYRTKDFRLIFGHSTTGAFIINTFLNQSDSFDIFFAGAPYHSDLFFQEDLSEKLKNFTRKKYLYAFYGLEDNETEKANWDSLANQINQLEINNFELINLEYPDEGHYSIIFRYIPNGLKLMFKDWAYKPLEGKSFSFDDFIQYQEIQKSIFNVSFEYSEGYFIQNGISLSQQDNSETAIELLNYGLEKYPQSDVLHNIIATEYERTGQKELAIQHYKILLELKPDLGFVEDKLKELESN